MIVNKQWVLRELNYYFNKKELDIAELQHFITVCACQLKLVKELIPNHYKETLLENLRKQTGFLLVNHARQCANTLPFIESKKIYLDLKDKFLNNNPTPETILKVVGDYVDEVPIKNYSKPNLYIVR